MFWKILIFASVSIGLFAYFRVLSSEVALFERYPEIDRQIVIKAHRIMLRRVLRGEYGDSEQTDEMYDKIFLGIVAEIS